MTTLNKQTTFPLQTLHTLILLMLFSAFGIGKCHAVQQDKENNAALTTEVKDGYLVMKPASFSSNVPSKDSAHSFSSGQYVGSQQSIISSPRFHYQHDDSNHKDSSCYDDDDQTVPGATSHSSYYDEEDLNNSFNGQNIVTDQPTIGDLLSELPQYNLLFASMLHSQSNNNIAPGTNATTANQERNSSEYKSTSYNHGDLEDEEGSMHQYPNDNVEQVGLGYMYSTSNNDDFVNSTPANNTPEGSIGEEEDSTNHVASTSLSTPDTHNASYHNILHQILNQNVPFTTNKMAGEYSIIWLYVTFGILYLTRYLFKIKILAKEGSSISSIFYHFGK